MDLALPLRFFLMKLNPERIRWGLGYATSSREADYCRHLFASERIGWDSGTGLPTREKLVELRLEDEGIQSMGD
jgi:hypothetical protein